MGIATLNINKKDDSTIWNFNRTWIEFYPTLYGKIKKIYIPEALAHLFVNENRRKLYEMFKNNEILDTCKEV